MLEEPVIPLPKEHLSHKVVAQPLPCGMQLPTQAKKPTGHKDENIALVLFLTGGFTICNIFRRTCHYNFVNSS